MSDNARNARADRHFAIAFCVLATVVGVGVGLLGWTLGPPNGDLARVGALSGRAHGWNQPWRGIDGPRVETVSLDALAQGADPGEILIIGDSFSDPEGSPTPWPSILATLTGRRVRVASLESDLTPVLRYFRSPAFAAAPPERVILELSERTVWRRARDMPEAECGPPPSAPAPLFLRPASERMVERARREDFDGFDEMMGWGALAARLRLLGASRTRIFTLTRDDLFSSKDAEQLLVFWEDVDEHLPAVYAPRGAEAAAAWTRCVLRATLATAGGRALGVIVPDKLTAYARWLSAPSVAARPVDFLSVGADAFGGAGVDLRAPLFAAIERGERDVYLPDDSHWGGAGQIIAARAVADALSGAER